MEEYERSAAQLPSMPDEQQLGYFMNGLRSEIKRRVRIHHPEDVYEATQLAIAVEEELIEESGSIPLGRHVGAVKGGWPVGGSGSGRFKRDTGSGQYFSSTGPTRAHPVASDRGSYSIGTQKIGRSPQVDSSKSPARSFSDSSSRAIRQLPYAEYQKRKEEGLCFRCGLKFGPMHKCPQRQMQVLILAEEPEAKGEAEFVMVEAEKDGDSIDGELLETGE